jgi:septal ring factor EnvC (AmiA/AmiB activator)
MPSDSNKKGGIYIPEWIWKALQSVLLAAVLGGYGMFYTMHTDLAESKLKMETLQGRVSKLEAEVEASRGSRAAIQTSLTAIETELPHLKEGIAELKAILLSR